MEDGSFVVLSVGITLVKVFLTPQIGDLSQTVELASFVVKDPAERTQLARRGRRPEDEKMLNQLRKALGFPKSIDELRGTLQTLEPSFFGYHGYREGRKCGKEWAETYATATELSRLQHFQKRLRARSQGEWEQWFWPEDDRVAGLELVKVIQDSKDFATLADAMEFWKTMLGESTSQADNGDFLRGFVEGAVAI